MQQQKVLTAVLILVKMVTNLKELTVQFVPSQNADTLEAKAKPLEKLLSKKLDIPVKVSVSTNYNTIVEAMKSKKSRCRFLTSNSLHFST